jgi:fructose-1-phosphate kinase PfkB-like protein
MVGENEIRIQQRIADEIESLDPKDLAMLAASAQRQATAKGINVTKVLELTGRPTHIIADQTGAELLRQLRDRVPGLVVESTAVEEPVKQIESPD